MAASTSGLDIGAERSAQRRAWLVLGVASTCFLAVLILVVAAARFYYQNATLPEPATVEVVGGTSALYRSEPEAEWNLIDTEMIAEEGDEISTALGTTVWITLFDGSTIEISENSIVEIERMRSSRFLNRTKEIELTVRDGSIYVAMAPHGEYQYSEVRARAGDVTVAMSDEPSRQGAGAFLLESQTVEGRGRDADESSSTVRVAVLRGAAMLSAPEHEQKLESDEQVMIEDGAVRGDITPAIRELVRNGSFQHGLSEWVEFHDSPARASGSPDGILELRWDDISGEAATALEMSRLVESGHPASVGIRQRIGQSLRVPSSLELRLDLRIASQEPPGAGPDRDTFPLMLELNYVDVQDEERTWRRGYYIEPDPAEPVPLSEGSQVEPDAWQHLVFNLNDLQPLPRQISSLVVYASGIRYQVMVANISLTTSEQQLDET
ncbi:MAG: hypothetical protein ACOC9Y_05605 [Chloroflexota bacterium]